MNEPDVARVIMSYLSNDTLKILYKLGIVPSLQKTAQDAHFWHSRVETLSKKHIEFSSSVDWKETYQILSDELVNDRPNFYNDRDNVTVLKILVSMGYVPNKLSLSEAARDGMTKILSFLLADKRIDPNAVVPEMYYPPLTLAADDAQVESVKILLADPRIDPNSDEGDTTALVQACCATIKGKLKDYLKIIEIFLEDRRADPRWNESISLECASDFADNVGVIQLLLKDGRADPRDNSGKSLAHAVELGREGIVRLLLKDKRVNPNDGDGAALIIAAKEGRTKIVKLLLADDRVNPNAQDGAALTFAIYEAHNSIVKLLLDDDRTIAIYNNNAALITAIENSNVTAVELLLRDPDVVAEIDDSYLELAEQTEDPEVIELIQNALEE
jgi:ankyrin repeat protein